MAPPAEPGSRAPAVLGSENDQTATARTPAQAPIEPTAESVSPSEESRAARESGARPAAADKRPTARSDKRDRIAPVDLSDAAKETISARVPMPLWTAYRDLSFELSRSGRRVAQSDLVCAVLYHHLPL
jgi:hypothetical protein